MIIERSMQDDWLSNAYLVGDEENGKAVVIDSGGPSGPKWQFSRLGKGEQGEVWWVMCGACGVLRIRC